MKQFQYTGWPEEGIPDIGSGLIDVIGQVQKWQRSSGDRPIVVHCRLVCRATCFGQSVTIAVIAVVGVVVLALIFLSVSYLND